MRQLEIQSSWVLSSARPPAQTTSGSCRLVRAPAVRGQTVMCRAEKRSLRDEPTIMTQGDLLLSVKVSDESLIEVVKNPVLD